MINARDAMPDGGTLIITTGVSVLSAEDLLDNTDATPGRFVTVSIQDSGSGMSDLVLKKVFEPFFTTKEIGKGSGLGLSQVFGFVRQSHGHCAPAQHRGNRHPRNDLPALPATTGKRRGHRQGAAEKRLDRSA